LRDPPPFPTRRSSDLPVLSIETCAYNWQQGARAMWLDADHFIFNDFDAESGRYIARVYSVAARREKNRYDYPVQDAFGTEYFLSDRKSTRLNSSHVKI